MKKIQVVGLLGAGFVVGAITIGLWFGGIGRHQPTTQAMTHSALIQQAISQLAQNKIGKDILEDPQVRDATVVYFKIKPDQNVEVVLDSHSGEQIMAHFGPISQPLIRDYISH